MRSHKAIVCQEHKTVIVVDEDCNPETLYTFLIDHRLCKLEFFSWTSTLDAEDNGFPPDIYDIIH